MPPGGRQKGVHCTSLPRPASPMTPRLANEVRRVLLKLRELMPNGVSGFKPDVFTALGIGTGNAWRLKPTIYSVQEVLGWQAQ